MSVADRRRLLSEIALYVLEELAARGGRSKAKYLRSYRALQFWAGEETARDLLKRLADAGYVKIDKDVVILVKDVPARRSLKEIEKLSLAAAKSLHKL